MIYFQSYLGNKNHHINILCATTWAHNKESRHPTTNYFSNFNNYVTIIMR